MKIRIDQSILTVVFIVLAAAASTAQTANNVITEFLPLAQGNRWEYAVSATGNSAVSFKSLVTIIDGTSMIGDHSCVMLRSDYDGGVSGSIRYLAYDVGGSVIDCALGTSNGLVLAEWDPPHLMMPFNAARRGTSWDVLYNLINSSPDDAKPGKAVTVIERYTVDKTGMTLETPAGKFENCILVKSERSAGNNGKRTVLRWYAPGVGEVKSVVEAPEDQAATTILIAYEVHGERVK